MTKFNSINEVITDYLTEYKGIKENIKYWFDNCTKPEKLFLRLIGTTGNNTLKTYKVNKKGEYIK